MSTIRIPIFEAAEDAYWWVLCIEKYFKQWFTLDALKMKVAGLAMKGPALTWWLHWYPSHRLVNWDAFTTIFLWKFKPEWRVILPLPDDEDNLELQPTVMDEGINDSYQISSLPVVSRLKIVASIKDSPIQSQIAAKTSYKNEHEPLFFEQANLDDNVTFQSRELIPEGGSFSMIVDTVPGVVAEQKEHVTTVGNFVVPHPVSDSDLAFVKFPPPPPKPPEPELSSLSHGSSQTTIPPLFQSPETQPTPPKPPRPPDCVSILISPSPPTSETIAKTVSVLVPSSPPIPMPEHIHSSQAHVKFEPHSHHRGFNNDDDFANEKFGK
ncbi:hypothetical protein P8452_11769 [Trifolium repens]|nr:hypothetical protein P8452_11769 [Trifolium repens]